MNEQTNANLNPAAGTENLGASRRFPRVSKALMVLAAIALTLVSFAAPAEAASTVQPANCNYNYNTGVKSVVVRAPKIWSNNGTTQSVRFRSYLRKWNGSAWVVPSGAIGQWHQGTATPNTAYVGPAGTWTTKSVYGAGYYSVGIQVQYYNGAWGGQTTQIVGTYYQNTYHSGAWHFEGTVGYCTHL